MGNAETLVTPVVSHPFELGFISIQSHINGTTVFNCIPQHSLSGSQSLLHFPSVHSPCVGAVPSWAYTKLTLPTNNDNKAINQNIDFIVILPITISNFNYK